MLADREITMVFNADKTLVSDQGLVHVDYLIQEVRGLL